MERQGLKVRVGRGLEYLANFLAPEDHHLHVIRHWPFLTLLGGNGSRCAVREKRGQATVAAS